MKTKIFLLLISGIIITYLFYNQFEKKNTNSVPINLNKNHICDNDSMIIIDYKGPKAQILWKDNRRSFYCEVREAFYETTNEIKKRNIKAFYVQDFSNIEWDSYIDKWDNAEKMYYVIDSAMDGAMGLTYVPFSDIIAAKNFYEEYGGKLLHYKDINKDTINNSNMLLKDRIIF